MHTSVSGMCNDDDAGVDLCQCLLNSGFSSCNDVFSWQGIVVACNIGGGSYEQIYTVAVIQSLLKDASWTWRIKSKA